MKKSSGLSLLEIIIAVAIVAVLASVAYPSFKAMILAGHRSEAFTALAGVRHAQSRYRSNNPEYAPNEKLTVPTGPPPTGGLGLSATSSTGLYVIDIIEKEGWYYTVRATAQGAQVKDKKCIVLVYRLEGEKHIYGGGKEGVPLTDPDNCWKRG